MIRSSTALSPHRFSRRATAHVVGILHGDCLDRELAAGAPPGWSRSLAVRADHITSVEQRRQLATDWEHLLRVAHRPVTGRTRLRLCRDRIFDAEPDIREMSQALMEAGAEAASGVAAASLLLRDGAGPLYNRLSATDLVDAVRAIVGLVRSEPPKAS